MRKCKPATRNRRAGAWEASTRRWFSPARFAPAIRSPCSTSSFSMRRLLELHFGDGVRAAREIAELSRVLPRELADRVDLLLAASPAPEQGLRYLARFPPNLITPKNARPLVAIFTNSHFLSEEVIEHSEWIAEPRD